MRNLVLNSLVLVLSIGVSTRVHAGTYGAGTYNDGLYSVGTAVTESVVSEESTTGTTTGYQPQVSTVSTTPTTCAPGILFSPSTGVRCTTTSPTSTVSSASPSKFLFTKLLSIGKRDLQVQELQKYLNTHGFPVAPSGPGSLGNETTLFGRATKAALIKFQIAHKILPATGVFGPKTTVFINTH